MAPSSPNAQNNNLKNIKALVNLPTTSFLGFLSLQILKFTLSLLNPVLFKIITLGLMPLAGLMSKEHWYQGSVTKPNLIIIFSKHLIQHILIKAQNRLSYVFETRNYFIGWSVLMQMKIAQLSWQSLVSPWSLLFYYYFYFSLAVVRGI